MDTSTEFRRLFADMVHRHDENIDLALAALYIAGEDCPNVDVEGSINLLDSMAHEIGGALNPSMDLTTQLQYLSQYLGLKQGFCGDEMDYYNPQNVYLHRVLERKRGIPIALSLIYIEVGYRLGIVFETIGLPGHVVIRTGPPEMELYIDPFNRGGAFSKTGCRELVENMFGGGVEVRDDFLLPYNKKRFLIRLLDNLKNMYSKVGDYQKAVIAADRIDLIDPTLGRNLRERAWMYQRAGQHHKAIEDLESYLRLGFEPTDAHDAKRQIQALWKMIVTLN